MGKVRAERGLKGGHLAFSLRGVLGGDTAVLPQLKGVCGVSGAVMSSVMGVCMDEGTECGKGNVSFFFSFSFSFFYKQCNLTFENKVSLVLPGMELFCFMVSPPPHWEVGREQGQCGAQLLPG